MKDRPLLRCRVLLAALAGAAAMPVAADGSAERSLEPIVVTGTRTERPSADSPVRVEVVDREEIDRTHARTLKEALENVPGLQLRPIHGKAGYEASLQGLSGEQVLVLVDGLPMTATTGSTVDLSQLALADVERIEVVKGAMSAQYGSAAMGGVINVITRDIAPGLAGSAVLDAGSYGAQNPSDDAFAPGNRHGRFRVQGGSREWRLRLAGDIRDSDGVDPEPATWSQPGDAVQRRQLDLRGEWRPRAGSTLYLGAGSFRERAVSRFVQSLPGREVEQQKREDAQRLRLGAGGEWSAENGFRLRLDAVDETLDDETRKHAAGSSFDDRDAELGLRHVTAIADLPALGGHLLQLGATWQEASLAQSIDGGSELDTAGTVVRDSREVFLQDDIFIGDDWELLLGLRHQDDSDFGGHAAPKVSLRGRVLEAGGWKGVLRAGWAEGYRVPNLKERRYRFDHSSLGYVVIGNPDLQPETSRSWQLGGRFGHGPGTWLDINLFDNRLRDLIQVDTADAPVVDGVQQFTYENVARARTRGAEIAARWQASDALALSSGYTRMRTRDEETGSALTRRPDHQARLGVDWQVTGRVAVSARGRYQSDELVATADGARSPSWQVLDLKINLDWSRSTRWFLGVDNVFNTQRDFADPNDFGPINGRFVYAGLRYAWRIH